MAKVGFWLNGAKGKLAGTTIYKSGANTVQREIVAPKNPRTQAQILQRIISKTVMMQYSAMKAICNHSFEGKSIGQECMSRFVSLNNRKLRDRIASLQADGVSFSEMVNFCYLKSSDFAPAAVVVSEGTLPEVPAGILADASAATMGDGSLENTYKSIIDAYGLQRGDQLTFLTVNNVIVGGNYKMQFKYARVILDPRESDGSGAALTTPFCADGVVNKGNFRNEGAISVAFNNGKFEITLGTGSVAAAAIIVSRKGNNYWYRSNAQLVLNEDALAPYDASLQDCIDAATEGATSVYVADENYLNNAGEGGDQAVAEPAPEQETPSVSNTVTMNGDNLNVAGGSVEIEPPSGTNMTLGFSGHRLNELNLSVIHETSGGSSSSATVSFSNNNQTAEATMTTPNIGDTVTVKKGSQTWFVISFVQGDGQGQPERP